MANYDKDWGKTYPSKAYEKTNVYAEEAKLDLKTAQQQRLIKQAVDRSYSDGKRDGYNSGFRDGVEREQEKAQDKIYKAQKAKREKVAARKAKNKLLITSALIAVAFLSAFAAFMGIIYLSSVLLGEWGPAIPMGLFLFSVITWAAYFMRKDSRS